MEQIPKQVFENLGYSKDSESDMKSLSKRYAKKSMDEVARLAANVVRMRRENKPYWLISYANGLSIKTCKELVNGTYFESGTEDEDSRVNDSVLISKATILKMSNGDDIWRRIQKKEFPYHHVYDTKLKVSGKLYFLKAEFEMAHYFDQKKKPIAASETYRKLDFNKKARVRYELRKEGVDITTYKRQPLVDKSVLDAVDAIALRIMAMPSNNKVGRPRKDRKDKYEGKNLFDAQHEAP